MVSPSMTRAAVSRSAAVVVVGGGGALVVVAWDVVWLLADVAELDDPGGGDVDGARVVATTVGAVDAVSAGAGTLGALHPASANKAAAAAQRAMTSMRTILPRPVTADPPQASMPPAIPT